MKASVCAEASEIRPDHACGDGYSWIGGQGGRLAVRPRGATLPPVRAMVLGWVFWGQNLFLLLLPPLRA